MEFSLLQTEGPCYSNRYTACHPFSGVCYFKEGLRKKINSTSRLLYIHFRQSVERRPKSGAVEIPLVGHPLLPPQQAIVVTYWEGNPPVALPRALQQD